jgi:lambda family phage tail tape measure protein
VPAAKALGGYLLGLLNPTTLLAGAAGALFIAYQQGAKESQELNKVLIMTGDYAGKSADQLNEMAKSIARSTGSTRSAAADALIEVVGTGKIAADQMEHVGAAAVEMSRATGRSVKDIVAEFVQLGEEPVKASAKLNEQYHYLTESVYEQIQALEKQGAKEQAVAIAQGALADAFAQRSKKVQDNLGYLEVAWNGVAKAAKWAWDSMMNLGRDQTGSEQLESLKKQLEIRQKQGAPNAQFQQAWEKGNQVLKDQIALIERLNGVQAQQAKQEGANAKAQSEGIAAADRVNKLQDQAKGVAAVNRELKEYHADLERIRKVNPTSELLDPKKIKEGEDAIRKAHQGDSLSKGDQAIDARIKALQGQLDAEARAQKETVDQLKANYDIGLLSAKEYLDKSYEAKQSSLEREFAIAKKQEELARGKQNVAAQEQYKNEQKKILDQIEGNFADHANAVSELSAKAKRAVDAYTESLTAQLRTRQSGIDEALSGADLSDRERARQLTLAGVRNEYDKKSEDLLRQRQKGEAHGGISEEEYQAELASLNGYYRQRLAQEKDYNTKSDALRQDWSVGAKKAYADYAEGAADAAGQSNRVFTDAMQGMEDALVTFATTGKLSFKGLANSIIADLARIQAKKLISGLFGDGKTLGGGGPAFGKLLQSMGSWRRRLVNTAQLR